MTPIWFSISCLWREVRVSDEDAWPSLHGLGQSALQVCLGVIDLFVEEN